MLIVCAGLFSIHIIVRLEREKRKGKKRKRRWRRRRKTVAHTKWFERRLDFQEIPFKD